jgi:hypothetical protein
MKQLVFLFVLGVVFSSCDDMDKSLKESVPNETVYAGKFDNSPIGKVGYERVEITLKKAGQIPSSQNMGRATKTFVKYGADSLVVDSVCSLLKINGLKEQNTYRFLISSMDEYGSKSVPVEVSLTPFTATDEEYLVIPAPVIIHNTTTTTVQWNTPITTNSLKYVGLTYSYTDNSGALVEDSRPATPEQPALLSLPNVPSMGVTVNISYRVIPKVSSVQILDTIRIERPLIIPAL